MVYIVNKLKTVYPSKKEPNQKVDEIWDVNVFVALAPGARQKLNQKFSGQFQARSAVKPSVE